MSSSFNQNEKTTTSETEIVENINKKKKFIPYAERPSKSNYQWIPAAATIFAVILILSGLTIYAFVSFFQAEQVEKKGVNFPFNKERLIDFTETKNINLEIRNAVHKEGNTNALLELVFQKNGQPLFIDKMLEDIEGIVSEQLVNQIENFSVGAHRGDMFILIDFKKDAFPVLLNNSTEIFTAMEYFTGRASTRELERVNRANTLIIKRNGDTIYGFLNDKTVAITGKEDLFLKILEKYRASFNK